MGREPSAQELLFHPPHTLNSLLLQGHCTYLFCLECLFVLLCFLTI